MSNNTELYKYPVIAVETKRDRCVCRSCANERRIALDMIHFTYTSENIYEFASCWYCDTDITPRRTREYWYR